MKFNLYLFEYVNIIALLLLFYYYKSTTGQGRIFLFFLIIAIIFESILVRYMDSIKYNSEYPFAIYATAYCATFYNILLLRELKNHKLFRLFISYLIIWELVNLYLLIFQKEFIGINGISYVIGLTLFVIMFLTYCHERIFNKEFTPIWSEPTIWLGVGITIMYVACFTTFIFLNDFFLHETIKTLTKTIIEAGNLFLSFGYFMSAICFTPVSKYIFKRQTIA